MPGWNICPNGCADNEQAPYLSQCGTCHRDYTTGRPLLAAGQCFECESREADEILAREDTWTEGVGRAVCEQESFDLADAGDQRERLKRRQRQLAGYRDAMRP
jgi:hypothetical protein